MGSRGVAKKCKVGKGMWNSKSCFMFGGIGASVVAAGCSVPSSHLGAVSPASTYLKRVGMSDLYMY
jgi:hypothetical protein